MKYKLTQSGSEIQRDLDVIEHLIDEYDSGNEYNKQDLATHLHKIYICLEDGVTGEFDSSKWMEVNLEQLLWNKNDKEGPLPSYSFNSNDNVLNFITNNNLVGKAIVLTSSSGTYIGGFATQTGTTTYVFEFELVGSSLRYVGQTDMSNMTFYDLFGPATYKEEYEITNDKVTSISSSSTDKQYPSAKAVWDECQNIREVAEGKCKTYVLSYAKTAPTTNVQAQKLKKVDGTAFTDLADFTTYIEAKSLNNASFGLQDSELTLLWRIRPLPDEPYKSEYYYIFDDGMVVKDSDLPSIMKDGDVVLVKELDVPDRWIMITTGNFNTIHIYAYKLETSKVDLSGKEDKSNKVTSLSASSTDTEYPSAKAVWEVKGTKLYQHDVRITTPSGSHIGNFVLLSTTNIPFSKNLLQFILNLSGVYNTYVGTYLQHFYIRDVIYINRNIYDRYALRNILDLGERVLWFSDDHQGGTNICFGSKTINSETGLPITTENESLRILNKDYEISDTVTEL